MTAMVLEIFVKNIFNFLYKQYNNVFQEKHMRFRNKKEKNNS